MFLGDSGFKVPVLGLGTGTFGKGPLFSAWGADADEARRLVDICPRRA
jgi:aryl-alcohol dehydrogenase-like predicted oxidoreductase